jgi:Na+/melibiose symporter-like transporter
MAFSVQSVLVRLPRVIGAPLGGLLIASFGVLAGVRIAAGITLLLATVVLFAQQRGYREQAVAERSFESARVGTILARMPAALKRLLVAECLVRFGEAIAAAFIVLYVTNVLEYSAPAFGTLYALQQAVSLVMYLPAGRLADLTGRRPLIALTFLFFALFPLAVQWAHGFTALVAAFVIGGLKEMADPSERARAVGVYYTIRNLLIVPAGAIGGILWTYNPRAPLQVAGAVGMIGVAAYWITSEDIR